MEALGSQSQRLTSTEFAAAASVDQLTTMVGYMFELQTDMLEALSKASTFLAVYGLIYPDGMVGQPLYQQFTKIPPTPEPWPHRPERDPTPAYHGYPITPLENPVSAGAMYPPNASPDVFIASSPGNVGSVTASAVALSVWRQIVRGQRDAENYDLDADRGQRHPCWATAGSIDDDPVGVDTLAYSDT
jgi:hypothetical protein